MRLALLCFDAESAVELAVTATPAAARDNTRKRATRLNTDWLPSETRQHPPKTFFELNLRRPAENLFCTGYVRLSDLRVVHRQRFVDDFASRPCYPDHGLCKLHDGELTGVAQVDRLVLCALREQIQTADHVVDVTEAAGLRPVAEDRQRLVLERLPHER